MKSIGRSLLPLQAASFLIGFDRFIAAPILLFIAADFGLSLVAVAPVAGVYFIVYGALQAFWGFMLDRTGRIRAVRISLFGAAIVGTASAFAPNIELLTAGRALTAVMFSGIFPALMVYIGDILEVSERQRWLARMSAMSAVGAAVACLSAGVLAEMWSWRAVFVVSSVGSLIVLPSLKRLSDVRPEIVRSPITQLREMIRYRWVGALIVFAFLDGALILGVMTFFATVLGLHGHSADIAGVTVAVFGVAVLGWSKVVRHLVEIVSPPFILISGTISLVIGYLVAAGSITVFGIGAATVGVAGGWSLMHSCLQTWATQVAPTARAVSVSFFSASVFVGSAVATWVVSKPIADGHYHAVFLVSACCSAIAGIVMAVANSSYRLSRG